MNLVALYAEMKHGALSHEDAESFEVGGVFTKVMRLKAGQSVITHSHSYTHAHILGKGRIMIEVDGEKAFYEAPAVIEILAGKHHGITAITDSFGFCVHNTAEIEAVAFEGN